MVTDVNRSTLPDADLPRVGLSFATAQPQVCSAIYHVNDWSLPFGSVLPTIVKGRYSTQKCRRSASCEWTWFMSQWPMVYQIHDTYNQDSRAVRFSWYS